MKILTSLILLLCLALSSLAATVYPASTNGNNVFTGVNTFANLAQGNGSGFTNGAGFYFADTNWVKTNITAYMNTNVLQSSNAPQARAALGVGRDLHRYSWVRSMEDLRANTNLSVCSFGCAFGTRTFIYGSIETNLIGQLLRAGRPQKGILFNGGGGFYNDANYGTPTPAYRAATLRDSIWIAGRVDLTNSTQAARWGDGAFFFPSHAANVFRVYLASGADSGFFKIMQLTNTDHVTWSDVPGLTAIDGKHVSLTGSVLSWTNADSRPTEIMITNWGNGKLAADSGTNYVLGASWINTATNGLISGDISLGSASFPTNVLNVPTTVLNPIFWSLTADTDLFLVQWITPDAGATNYAAIPQFYSWMKSVVTNSDIVIWSTYSLTNNLTQRPDVPSQITSGISRTNAAFYGLAYFDLFSRVGGMTNAMRKGWIISDGIHPSPGGCDYFSGLICEWLDLFGMENQ